MIDRNSTARPYVIALIVLTALYTVANIVWLVLDTRPPHSDSVVYLLGSASFCERVQSGDVVFSSLFDLVVNRPPMQSWVGAVVLPFVNWRPDRVLFVNAFWQLLAVWLTFLLGRKLGGPACGFMGAVFIMTHPLVHAYMQQYETEIPLMAVVAASLYVTTRVVENARPQHFVYLGSLMAAGMLFKWIYAVAAGPPLIYGLLRYMYYGPTDDADASVRSMYRRLAWTAAALSIPAIAALPWYALHLRELLTYNEWVSNSNKFTPFHDGWTVRTIWYFPSLIALRLKIVHLVLFIAGSVSLCWQWRRFSPAQKTLIKLIGISLLFFELYFAIQYKNLAQKYILPIQPLMAVLAGSFVCIFSESVKKWVIIGISTVLFVVLIHNQWSIPGWTSHPKAIQGPWMERQTAVCAYDPRTPQKCLLDHSEIVDAIAKTDPTRDRPFGVFVLPSLKDFSYYTLDLWMKSQYPQSKTAGFNHQNNLLDLVFHDYFIDSQGPVIEAKRIGDKYQTIPYDVTVRLSQALKTEPSFFSSSHQRIGRILYRDSIPIDIYKRTKPADAAEASEIIGLAIDEVIQYPMWKQAVDVWRRLKNEERVQRMGQFQAAVQRKNERAVQQLLQTSDEEIDGWLPYERYLLAALAEREKQTARALNRFKQLSESPTTCSIQAEKRISEIQQKNDGSAQD